mgnify:CR=1 FL=1
MLINFQSKLLKNKIFLSSDNIILKGLKDKMRPILWGNKSNSIIKPLPKMMKKNNIIEKDKKVNIRSDIIEKVTIIFASKKV